MLSKKWMVAAGFVEQAHSGLNEVTLADYRPRELPFNIHRALAIGHITRVHLASRADHPSMLLALKTLGGPELHSPELARGFRREVRIQESIDHPLFSRFQASGRDSAGRLYLATTRIPGRSLARIIESLEAAHQPCPEPVLNAILYGAWQALRTLHLGRATGPLGMSLRHGNVRPDNIMVGYDGFVRLIDFELSARDAHQTPGFFDSDLEQLYGSLRALASTGLRSSSAESLGLDALTDVEVCIPRAGLGGALDFQLELQAWMCTRFAEEKRRETDEEAELLRRLRAAELPTVRARRTSRPHRNLSAAAPVG